MSLAVVSPSRSEVAHILETAVMAPSSHNTQPWRFEHRGETIDVRADRTRALAVSDPSHRELTISCGAALFHLRLAVRQAGFAARVLPLPDPRQPDLLARVLLTRPYRADDEIDALVAAVPRRHTVRGAFADEPLPDGLHATLAAAAARDGVWWQPIPRGAQRDTLAALIADADGRLFADPAWRRELAGWLRPRRCGDGLAMPALVVPFARFVVSHIDLGARTGRQEAELVRMAPVVAIVGTARDAVEDWLHAGQALARVLLTAAGAGVQAGFANAPCQIAELRTRLAAVAGSTGHPQLVLRLGRPASACAAAARRPVADVLDEG